jgi:nitric oxide reductase subunit B
MNEQLSLNPTLSLWWRRSVLLVFVVGMIGLIFMSVQAYRYAPPIPEKVVDTNGKTIFTGKDIETGQQVFLRYGLMQNGSIWGHGSYLGPDFSAQYLHELSIDAGQLIAKQEFGVELTALNESKQVLVDSRVAVLLKENRYDPVSKNLTFIDAERDSFNRQLAVWTDYFKHPISNSGLPDNYINDPEEIRQLTAFFAWTAWASVANRPDKPYSYTNNFPYDPTVGNLLTSDAVLWSALSVAMLLAGLAVVLFVFGKFDYLGWKGGPEGNYPQMLIGEVTEGQRATIKYFVIVALLFLTQVMIGGALAHYRAEPGNFYGIDLAQYLPSNILRTWHLQLAIFWIATAYIAGGLLLASSLSQKEPRGHATGVHMLFWALVVLVVGSLLGEFAGIHQLFGNWLDIRVGSFLNSVVSGRSFW